MREKGSSPKKGVVQESAPQRGQQGENRGVGGLSRNICDRLVEADALFYGLRSQ